MWAEIASGIRRGPGRCSAHWRCPWKPDPQAVRSRGRGDSAKPAATSAHTTPPPTPSRRPREDEGTGANTAASRARHSQGPEGTDRHGAAARPRPAAQAGAAMSLPPSFSESRCCHVPPPRRLVSFPESCCAADTHHGGGWRRILGVRGEQGSAPTMAAAAAEETADVNARPFICPRRLGASRDGAGALRAWLDKTQLRADLRMRKTLLHILNT